MPGFALLLLFASALLHTSWNLLLKRAANRNLLTWWAVLVGSGVLLPALFFTGLPGREILPLLLASVAVEVLYYLTLAAAYDLADFSLVYPLARGAAPALTALWAVWFLAEPLTPGGWTGLGAIVLGLLIIAVSALADAWRSPEHRLSPVAWKGFLLSIALALMISVYSTIDAAAVRRTPVLPYTILVFFLAPLCTAPLVLLRYRGAALFQPWRAHPWQLIGIGLLTVGAYLLALLAYAIAPLGYSAAVREVSVVLGALAGWLLLGERMGRWRLFGAGIVFAGILFIAILG